MAEVEKLEKEEEEDMKPWEQHSAIISIPRFDYNAPSSLLHHSHSGFLITCPISKSYYLQSTFFDYNAPSSLLHHSHSGFLITCPIKREKSATKEAISILGKYIESSGSDSLKGSDSSENAKRRKLNEADSVIATKNDLSKDDSQCVEVVNNVVKQTLNLLLVKVTRSGLLLFTFPKSSSLDPVLIVSNIYQALDSGELNRPLWCHRIFPIQATCRLKEKEVGSTVSNLVQKYVNDKNTPSSKPLTFAVGYNRRGIEETEMKTMKDKSSDPDLCALLDRNKCFSVVAGAVKEVVSDATVDLKTPELCIFIELLPLSGVPNMSLVAAVSVLSRDLVNTKPRLCVKPLVLDAKAKRETS